jgi:uncharacterized protein
MVTKNPFANIFAASPFAPLQAHMSKVKECVDLLDAFFKACHQGNWESATELQGKISDLENEADQIKKDLRANLPNSLFLPVPRTDLLELISVQDKMANKAKDIAGLILGRKLQFPESLQAELDIFVARCLEAVAQAAIAIEELDELIETGFKGREVKLVEKMLSKLDKIEHDTDSLQRKLRAQLFVIENDLSPIQVMFMYKLIEWIGDLADRAQSTGNRLEILVAR